MAKWHNWEPIDSDRMADDTIAAEAAVDRAHGSQREGKKVVEVWD